ncbi:MAG: DASS family sodium-coupled anion symporter [Bacteroidota bacterium]
MNITQGIKLISGPLLFLAILSLADLSPGNPMVTRMAAVAAWMAVWWLTEAVHLAVTALLPVVLLPLLGIAASGVIASQYMDSIIFLFIGGFILAFAIERWGLHKRIALKILMVVGTKPSRILLGVMLTSYLLSMWISNTATVMMLLSAVFAIVNEMEQHLEEKDRKKVAAALMIGLAYSATIGGMGTLVGTPTNMIFARSYHEQFPDETPMNFANWFVVAFPVSLLFLSAAYFVLRSLFLRRVKDFSVPGLYFSGAYARLGRMSFEEKTVGAVFALTAMLWFTRADIDFGAFVFTGWETVLVRQGLVPAGFLHDSTVALFMAVLLFLIPSRTERGRALMSWKEAQKLPFDIVLLFGGGFALAKGVEISNLDEWLAGRLHFVSSMNIYMFLIVLCLVITIISEFASNVASIQLMIPVLISLQKDMQIHPLMLLVPATLAASLGFMLPVATAPNTIVYGSKRVRVSDMMKAGLILDLAGILLITLAMMFAGWQVSSLPR